MANKPFFLRRQGAKPMFGKVFETFVGANLSIVVGKYNKSKHFYICRVASTGSVVTIRASDLPSPIRSTLKEGTVISIPKGTAVSIQLASQLGFTSELKVTQDNLEKFVERFSRTVANSELATYCAALFDIVERFSLC